MKKLLFVFVAVSTVCTASAQEKTSSQDVALGLGMYQYFADTYMTERKCRCGYAKSIEDCMDQIDMIMESDNKGGA
jgi:hypothetical protein